MSTVVTDEVLEDLTVEELEALAERSRRAAERKVERQRSRDLVPFQYGTAKDGGWAVLSGGYILVLRANEGGALRFGERTTPPDVVTSRWRFAWTRNDAEERHNKAIALLYMAAFHREAP